MAGMPELVSPVVPAGRLRAQPQPTLLVDELVLRPWQLSDAPAVAAAYRDPSIQRWHVRSMDEAEAVDWVRSWAGHWAAETSAGWAVTSEDQLVGRIGFRTISLAEGQAEAAYWVLPAARGRAVASRALTAVTSWMFGCVQLHRIELAHSTRNEPSCRVALKAGYRYEGTKRQESLHADGWHDMHLHARLRGDSAPDGFRPG